MVADRSENQAKRMNTQKGEIEGKKKIKRRLKVKEKEEKDVCRKLIVCFRQIRSSIERQQRKQEEERKERNLSGIDTVHNNNNNNNDSDDDDDDDDDHKEDGDRKEKSGTEQREEGEERTTESGQDIIAGVLSETVARVAFQVEEERLHLGACFSNIIYIYYILGGVGREGANNRSIVPSPSDSLTLSFFVVFFPSSPPRSPSSFTLSSFLFLVLFSLVRPLFSLSPSLSLSLSLSLSRHADRCQLL